MRLDGGITRRRTGRRRSTASAGRDSETFVFLLVDARRRRRDQPDGGRPRHHLRLRLEPAERRAGDGALAPHRPDEARQGVPPRDAEHVRVGDGRAREPQARPRARDEHGPPQRRAQGRPCASSSSAAAERAHAAGPRRDRRDAEARSAHDIFLNDDDSAFQRAILGQDIDEILATSTKIDHNTDTGGGASLFSKAAFIAEEGAQELDMDDPEFWTKILPEAAQKA